jgi:gliding motility-associated-like protein
LINFKIVKNKCVIKINPSILFQLWSIKSEHSTLVKIILFLLILTFTTLTLQAQPKPCGPTPEMTSTCDAACIICDIDGFTGINNSSIQGEAPPGFCTTQVHHMQWIAFIAGTENITIEFSVFNCKGSNGLEVGIYEGENCDNFKLVTDCDTDISENSKRIFKNIKPLTVGQYYFWVMDGSNNDICNYSIKVLEGSTKVAPLSNAPEIIVPPLLCEDKELMFATTGLAGATIYDWSINGANVTTNNVLTTSFSMPGEYEICLDARNVCDKAPQSCVKINVQKTPETRINQEVCFGECFEFLGKKYCETKSYPIILQADNGCDSIITLDLKIQNEIVTQNSLMICEGDTLFLGDGTFTTQGNHIAYIQDADGCKIKVNLKLEIIKCNIKTAEQVIDVTCNDLNNGKIKYKITNGTAPFKYVWQKIENSSIKGGGTILNENQEIVIDSLDEGNYSISVFDGFGNQSTTTVHVYQPSILKTDHQLSNFNGYEVPCFGDNKGNIKTLVYGGNGDYKYKWSTNETTEKIENLKAGIYILTVTDKKNCDLVDTIKIAEPPKLELILEDYNPDCSGPFTGSIDVSKSMGGVPPYLFELNGNENTINGKFENLGTSINKITLIDKNGCGASGLDTLQEAEIPILSYDSTFIVELGDSVFVNIISNLKEQDVIWTSTNGVRCSNCLETYIFPFFDETYDVKVTSKDGCEKTAKIKVNLIKNYSFVTSNIISPNGDGYNDKTRINTKKDASSVLYYEVYDRWGNKVYQKKNINQGLVDLEWEGTFNGKYLAEGNYVWIAAVKYLDGIIVKYNGTLAIVK